MPPITPPPPLPRAMLSFGSSIGAVLLLFRFLLGNIYGIGILALIAYAVFPTASWSEVAQWLLSRPEATQTALASSLLTIVGFFIAFASGNAAAKREARNRLRTEAGHDLYNCLQGASTDIESLQGLALSLKQAALAVQSGKAVSFNKIAFLAEQCARSLSVRTSLVGHQKELSNLRVKHHGVLNAHIGGFALMDLAERVLSDVVEVWNYPVLNKSLDVDVLSQQLRILPPNSWDEFLEATEAATVALKPVLKLSLSVPAAVAFGITLGGLLHGLRRDL